MPTDILSQVFKMQIAKEEGSLCVCMHACVHVRVMCMYLLGSMAKAGGPQPLCKTSTVY